MAVAVCKLPSGAAAVAVTVIEVWLVTSDAWTMRVSVASPLTSVCLGAPPDARRPRVVVKLTFTPAAGCPVASRTRAISLVLPPVAGMLAGSAWTVMVLAPPAKVTASVVAVAPPPTSALTVALPCRPSPVRVAVATPPELVVAMTGVIVPRSVVKRTSVPLATGVPFALRTTAVMVELPVADETIEGLAESVMVDPEGAVGATFEHPAATRAARAAAAARQQGSNLLGALETEETEAAGTEETRKLMMPVYEPGRAPVQATRPVRPVEERTGRLGGAGAPPLGDGSARQGPGTVTNWLAEEVPPGPVTVRVTTLVPAVV